MTTLPSPLVVTTLDDESDVNPLGDLGDVSLREALGLANGSVGADTITFATSLTEGGPASIRLTLGEFLVSDAVTISGPGVDLLTIDAQGSSRIFNVDDFVEATQIEVEISGLTLTGGEATDGGAILSRENLALTASTITGNTTQSTGGGVTNVGGGTLTVTNSTISGNSTLFDGGGLWNDFGTLTVTGSTISGNTANRDGGGLFNRDSTLTVTDSTISGNAANRDGGGLFNRDGTLTVTGSTISGNSANTAGGGLSNFSGELTVTGSTIVGNRSDADGNGSGSGGGIFTHNASNFTRLRNTIVAGNQTGFSGTASDLAEKVVEGDSAYNLIGDPASAGGLIHDVDGTGNHNFVGQDDGSGGRELIDIATVLGPLAFNGGPTLTHALRAGSPAINAGSSSEPNDQRGAPFLRDDGGGVDIGAYERQTVATLPSPLVVTTLDDELDANPLGDLGDVSLREALGLANGSVGADTITFATSQTDGGPASIRLTLGEFPVIDAVTISGPGVDLLTIDAQGSSRIFNVDDFVEATQIEVEISGLALTGGQANDGGAILSRENLALTASTITGNTTQSTGGGVTNVGGGTLTVTNSTISGNLTLYDGGGLWNDFGTLTVTDSTITGNTANHSGGGLFGRESGTLTVTGSTISGNTARYYGGGLSNGGTLTVTGSTITGNAAAFGGGLSNEGTLTVTDSTISGNTALHDGGGLMNSGGTLTVTDSTISGNSAGLGGGLMNSGGTLTVTDSTISGNTARLNGGGLSNRSGGTTVTDTTISGNTALHNGGGLMNSGGTLSVTDSTISGNSANFGGGGFFNSFGGELSVTGSTITGNAANRDGGGLWSYNGSSTVTGSTVSGNSANDDGGGLFNGHDGGELSVTGSTIVGNRSDADGNGSGSGGGLFAVSASNFTRLLNTIVAGNLIGTGVTAPASDLAGKEVEVDSAHNLIGDPLSAGGLSEGTNGNLVGDGEDNLLPLVDILDPTLAIFGGSTAVHMLASGSRAIDAADGSLLPTGVTTDQRGFPRTIDLLNIANATGSDGTDIGAVEMVGLSIANTSANEDDAMLEFTVNLSHPIPDGETVTVQFDTSDIAGQAEAGSDYTAIANQTISFTGGGPLTQTVGVIIADDSLVETSETLLATLSNPVGAIIEAAEALGTINDNDDLPRDYGNAPEGYPVTSESNGASHLLSDLFLGSDIDAETNGQPSAASDGDGADEDGIVQLADIVAVSGSSTTASFLVTASQTGLLDAWIDFDGNQSWDPGDQIAASFAVSSGSILLSFIIPVGAAAGTTAARFRLSTAGGLPPTGPADDGEVEDYIVSILDGSTSPNASVNLVSSTSMIVAVNGSLVVRTNPDLFSVPIDTVGHLDVQGILADETITLDVSGGSVIPQGGLGVHGGGGSNVLQVTGGDVGVDFTAGGTIAATNFAVLDLSDPGASQVKFDAASVTSITPTGRLTVLGGQDDEILFDDIDDWRMGSTAIVDGRFVRSITNVAGGAETIDTELPYAWHNLVKAGDVNNNGEVTAIDALVIINELGRRRYSDTSSSEVDDPLTVNVWPGVYYDQNGDNKATALDALRVINELARIYSQTITPSGETVEPIPQELARTQDHGSSVFEFDEDPVESPVTFLDAVAKRPKPIDRPHVSAFDSWLAHLAYSVADKEQDSASWEATLQLLSEDASRMERFD